MPKLGVTPQAFKKTMGKINTTEKGDSFEKKVYDLFSELLSSGDFYLNSKSSKIFRKKSYYSEARKGYITVDISIESYIGNSENYSSLFIIECKNYSKSIPVDDIEEFSSKLNQIGEHNTKGVMVTNSSFQEGTFNFAYSKKIGLVRVKENQSFEWVNLRKDKKKKYIDISHAKAFLCSENMEGADFIGFYGNIGFDTISQMFVEMKIIDKFFNTSKFIPIPFLSNEAIEFNAKSLPSLIIYENGRLNTDKLCIILKELYEVQFDFENELNQQRGILGKIKFKPLIISITKQLKLDDFRWRFTLAHEVGHLILHKEIMTAYLEEYSDNENSIPNNQGIANIKNNRLEIQANIFANRLLMPKEYYLNIVYDYFNKENINKGHLYLDKQPCNMALTFNLLNELQYHFGISKEVAKYRLIEDGLLVDKL